MALNFVYTTAGKEVLLQILTDHLKLSHGKFRNFPSFPVGRLWKKNDDNNNKNTTTTSVVVVIIFMLQTISYHIILSVLPVVICILTTTNNYGHGNITRRSLLCAFRGCFSSVLCLYSSFSHLTRNLFHWRRC